MRFNCFGNQNNPSIILIHGTLTPWQMWESHIELLQKDYYIIVPILSAHDEIEKSGFYSIEKECEKIESYIGEQRILAVCGLSLGGAVAYKLWQRGNIKIQKIIMDGAPLCTYGSILRKIIAENYISILKGSQRRDDKTLENFEKYFLPKKYLESFLRIADKMSEESIKKLIISISNCSLSLNKFLDNSNALYMHGTAMNEYLSKKTVRLLKQQGFQNVICSDGTSHGEVAIYNPEKWCEIVSNFIVM